MRSQHKKALKTLLNTVSFASGLAALILWESSREINSLQIAKYDISTGYPENLRGKKLVFISDYHEAENGKLNPVIQSEIRNLHPDLILVGGDMVNGHSVNENIFPMLSLINPLADEFPVLYAFGNHEKKVYEHRNDSMMNLWDRFNNELNPKIKLLINEKYELKDIGIDNVSVYGLDIPLEYYSRISFPKISGAYINESLGCKNQEEYSILLGHAPDFIEGYSRWGADLVLSGHFHGGLIRIPFIGGVISPRLRPFPDYTYGEYNHKNSNGYIDLKNKDNKNDSTKMIVTGGLGQHSIKIRVNNLPEIVLISFT